MTTLAASQAELAQHARAILTAWARGDRTRLLRELEQNLLPAEGGDADAERYELLSAIANRMIASDLPDAAEDHDPQMRACLSLLAHLANNCEALD